jgi:hypothetical protein
MQSLALLPIGRTDTTATAERTSVAAARQLPDLAGAGGRGGAARAVSSPSPHRPTAAPSRTRSRATPPPCTVHGPPPGRSPGALVVLPPPQPPACERPAHGLPSPPHPHEHSPRPSAASWKAIVSRVTMSSSVRHAANATRSVGGLPPWWHGAPCLSPRVSLPLHGHELLSNSVTTDSLERGHELDDARCVLFVIKVGKVV